MQANVETRRRKLQVFDCNLVQEIGHDRVSKADLILLMVELQPQASREKAEGRCGSPSLR